MLFASNTRALFSLAMVLMFLLAFTRSLEKNSYDHITATYYLLIERRLRKHQQYEQQIQSATSVSLRKQIEPSSSRPVKPHLEPLMLSPRYVVDLTFLLPNAVFLWIFPFPPSFGEETQEIDSKIFSESFFL